VVPSYFTVVNGMDDDFATHLPTHESSPVAVAANLARPAPESRLSEAAPVATRSAAPFTRTTESMSPQGEPGSTPFPVVGVALPSSDGLCPGGAAPGVERHVTEPMPAFN
jgi:hypothetical protein